MTHAERPPDPPVFDPFLYGTTLEYEYETTDDCYTIEAERWED